MRRKFGALVFVLGLALLLGGCAQRLPLEEAGRGGAEPGFQELSAPLDLRSFEVVSSASGHRGVFLRLSRFPDGVSHAEYSDPARIVIDIQGPTGVTTPEESFPGGDSVVSIIRVSRELGNLRIVLDLVGQDPPPYTVHRMADYVLVRLQPPA